MLCPQKNRDPRTTDISMFEVAQACSQNCQYEIMGIHIVFCTHVSLNARASNILHHFLYFSIMPIENLENPI